MPPAPPTATAALQIVTARGGTLSRAGEDGRGVAHQPTTIDDVHPDITALGDVGDLDSDSSDSGSSGDSDGSDSDAGANDAARRRRRSDRATARLKQLAGGDTHDHARVVAMRKALVASVAATRRPPRRRTGP